MSSEALVEGPDGVYAAWETQGQVKFARVQPGTVKPSAITEIMYLPGPNPGCVKSMLLLRLKSSWFPCATTWPAVPPLWAWIDGHLQLAG